VLDDHGRKAKNGLGSFSLKLVCEPRASVFDRAQLDTVVDIADLSNPRFDADRFFEENHPTQGMQTLLRQVFERLCGGSPQGVFRLKQAMGGGKTHNMVAAGLLAKHPHLRRTVLGKLGITADGRQISLAAFTGREGSTQDFLWLDIARQLHSVDKLRGAEAEVPTQSAWVSIIGNGPTLILLDELPPYFELLATKQVGLSQTEADRLALALANLMSAILSDRLPNCCLVISDLAGSWASGSAALQRAISNTSNEINRGALDITPVRMDGVELYAILQTRLFRKLPDRETVNRIAAAYGEAYRTAIQQSAMPVALERWAAEVPTTYPFHPGMQDLFARFRENPGFQQTREMLRLSRRVVNWLWDSSCPDNPLLIHPHHLNFNDVETQNVLDRINPALLNARSRDVAKGGNATAEVLAGRPGLEAAADAAKTVFLSSLAIASNAVLGLSAEEVAAYLCAPGRDVSRYGSALLTALEDDSWYLHRRTDGRWVYRDVKNVVSAIRDRAQTMTRDAQVKEVQGRLREIFKPGLAKERGQGEGRLAYQELLVFPAVEDIQTALDPDKVLLAITEPDPNGLNPALRKVWENVPWRNRLMFLCGTAQFTNLLQSAAFKKAAEDQLGEFMSQKLADGSPEIVQTKDFLSRATGAFLSALRETFTVLHFPDLQGELRGKSLRLEFPENRFVGEVAILDTLKKEQKYRDDMESDSLREEFVQTVFVQNPAKWDDLERECARRADWYFHPPGGLRTLKTAAVRKDLWREEGGGYVRRGPFPPEPTEVVVSERVPQDAEGRVVLSITAKRGDRVHWVEGDGPPTESSPLVENGELITDAIRVTFLAVDSTGKVPTGRPNTWQNKLWVKYETPYRDGAFRLLLKAVPRRGSTLRYTFDGSDPKLNGQPYEGEVTIPEGTRLVLAVAENAGIFSTVAEIRVPERPTGPDPKDPPLDPGKPAVWYDRFRFTDRRSAFAALDCLKRLQGELGGARLNVQVEGDAARFLELTCGPAVRMAPPEIEAAVAELEARLQASEQPGLALYAASLIFPSGKALVEAAAELRLAPTSGRIEQ